VLGIVGGRSHHGFGRSHPSLQDNDRPCTEMNRVGWLAIVRCLGKAIAFLTGIKSSAIGIVGRAIAP
jgi:hypothetical protein